MSLISTEGLESALREILDRLAKQSQDISNLRTELSNAATRSEVQALEKAISTRIGSLERRIDRLELETSLDIPLDVLDANIAGGLELNESSFDGNRSSNTVARIPLARYVTLHQNHLRSLHNAVGLAATREELANVRRDADEALTSAIAAVGDEKAPRDAVTALQSTAAALQDQVTALQGMMAVKVDRSEMARINAIGAEVAGYASFKTAALADLRELGSRSEEHRAALDRSLESVTKLSAVVQALASNVASKADGKDVATLAAQLDRLSIEMGGLVAQEDFHSLSAVVSNSSSRVSTLENNIKDVMRSASEDRSTAESRLSSTAANLRSEWAAIAEALRREVNLLKDEVEARAYATSLQVTDENIAGLNSRMELITRKVEVALRFIDWYAEKGDAYEHNAAAVERAMNQLAVGSRSRVVDSIADFKARVLGSDNVPTLRSSYNPLSSSNVGGSSSGPSAGTTLGQIPTSPKMPQASDAHTRPLSTSRYASLNASAKASNPGSLLSPSHGLRTHMY